MPDDRYTKVIASMTRHGMNEEATMEMESKP